MSPSESYLHSLPRFAEVGMPAWKPGLARIAALLEGMGRPQDAYRAVLVAGTNGKGSVASMLSAILRAAGLRTGLHTSPHLSTLRERMRVDGRMADPQWLDGALRRYRRLIEAVEPSFFEATVALSLLYFAEERAEVAVVEVGLGGRLDASNVLEPRLALVTRIALDHQEILGPTVGAIAREKAGIARPGAPLLTAEERGEALDAIVEEASDRGACVEVIRATVDARLVAQHAHGLVITLRTPRGAYDEVPVGLAGAHQLWNAALAVRAAEHLLGEVHPVALRRGLAEVVRLAGLAGRCQVIMQNPLLMVDVAHNPDGLEATLATFGRLVDGRKTVVLGLMRDKDAAGIAARLARPDLAVVPVALPSDRAFTADELRAHLAAAGANVLAGDGVHLAVERFRREAAPSDGLLATGSHQVAAEAFAAAQTGT